MIRGQYEFSRSIEETFDYFADFRNENEWNPVAHDVQMLTEPPIGKGSRFRGEYDRVGTMQIEIMEYDRPRHLVLHVRSNWFDFVSTFNFATRGDVTQLVSAIDAKPKGVFRLVSPLLIGMLKRQLKTNWGLLKRTLESRPR